MGHSDHATPADVNLGPGYETRDANSRAIFYFGIMLVLFLVAVILAMLGVFDQMAKDTAPKEKHAIFEDDMYKQLRLLRESEDKRLESYDWVDRKSGVVRIPIERAFELALQRGLPKGKGPQTEVQINSRETK
ncbi:hypothetical protein [Singulisphaera sp. PoT]|uniref:hypothetical protein n=1 Tax=Singulisphaera sp. PoT TaxID=3411797 RepID=UPI003BF4B650